MSRPVACIGDVVRNLVTGKLGTVRHVQPPNLPWHNGGAVHTDNGGWWHDFVIVEPAGEDE